MAAILVIVVGLLCVGAALLARQAVQKIQNSLKKSGVQLTWSSISSTSVKRFTVALEKGPLQSLTIDSIAWGPAARSRSSDTDAADSSTQRSTASAWLPVRVTGLRIVISSSAHGRGAERKPKAVKRSRAGSKAKAAATTPAVSSALAIARRLLPHLPIQLQQVAVELQATGLSMQLKSASLHWSVKDATIGSMLLLQDLVLVPAVGSQASVYAELKGSQSTSVLCPLVKVSIGIEGSRGMLPVSCSHLGLQVGQVRVTGLSQFLMLACAATVPGRPAAAVHHNRQASLDGDVLSEAGTPTNAAVATSSKLLVPGDVAKAAGLMPDKVKLGFAGIKIVQCAALPAGAEQLQVLPHLQGSVGAITLAASSCSRPAAVRAGEKLLSMSFSLGTVQLKASGGTAAGGTSNSTSSASPAAELKLAGISVTADLAKAANSTASSSNNEEPRVGPLQQHLFNRQQPKQQHQMQASCKCKLLDRPTVQLHVHQVPALVQSVQLLLHSLQHLDKQRQEAATASLPLTRSQEQRSLSGLLSRENSFSPLPHPDTPGLGTPTTPGPLHTPEGPGGSQRQGRESSSADGSTRAGTGFIPASPLAAGAAAAGALQQRLASFRRGPVAEYSSIVMDVTVALDNGISVEVLTGSAAPAAALSLQLEAGAHAEWASPINSSASGMSATPAAQPAKQRSFSFATSCNIQQVSVSIATAGTNRPHMQQLLLLDLLELRATSTDGVVYITAVAADAAGMALPHSTNPLACDASITAGQVQLTPNAEILAAALQLAEQAYVVPARAPAAAAGGFGSAPVAAAGSRSLMQRRARKRRRKHQLQVASLDVMLQSLTVTYSSDLPVCQDLGTPAAFEAAARGVQSQLAARMSTAQLSMQPAQQYLAASIQLLQVGYSTSSQSPPSLPAPQSVELLLMQGMEFRRYLSHDLQLLKVFLQQLRSEVHVDAAVSAAGMVEATLQLTAATVHRLQEQHIAAAAANADHHTAVLGIADAAAAVAGVADATTIAQTHGSQGLAAEDSFTALAGRSSPSDSDVSLATAHSASQQAGLPPLAPFIQNGQMPPQEQTKPLLALDARLQDVAIQVSVCEHDALMVQMELVKYSSVLEQGIVEKLRFSINERSVIQIPHLAVHQLPGWLPPGAAAGAAALGQQQRAWSPDRGGIGDSPGPPSRPAGPRHKSWSVTPDEVTRKVTAGGSPGTSDRHFDCCTSYESVRFCDDGGVQSWQSIDDPVPSASLGSRRPPSSKDPALYQRQAARQQAGRDRCKVPQAAADSSAVPDSSAAAELISLDVYAERVLFSVPHDEAPGRIILVCETWAKAVKQVVLLQLKGIKESLVVMKAATAGIRASLGKRISAAKAPKAKTVKPAYLELQAHLQQIVFCLEQNPLETWMGLHGPVLQAMVAERHLVEQLLTSCSSAHGRISRTGGSSNAARAKGNETVRAAMQLPAANGKKQHAPLQKRRWGSLGRRTAAVSTAIAAGSAVDAVVAATAGPAAAALAALAPEPTSTQQGLLGAAIPALEAAAAVAPDSGGGSQPTSPRADLAAFVDPEAEAATDDDGLDPAAEGDLAASDDSDEVDSSDDEDAAFVDPDVLAAVLPSSASALAGAAAAAPDAAAGSAGTGAGSGEDLQKVQGPAQAALDSAPASEQGGSEMQQAVLQAHMELFSLYKFRCRPLHAASQDVYHHSRAVMHVSVARAEAVVLISLPGHAASDTMAMEVIKRVDPASEGIVMERFQSISLDVGLQDIVAHFGGVEEMASTVGSLGASGLLIRARQLSAMPQMRPMRMCVGTWHQADVPVVVKGTRPPMKMYTHIKAELDDVQGAFCPGLEAPFGQLNLAFKRITVPNNLNPDGSVPPSTHPGLPWWDMMGYMWRGVANVRLRGLTAVLANTENPHVGVRDEKLALTAATLGISVAAGKIDVTTTNMSAVAHAAVPDAAPGDSLLVLPGFHLPLVTLTFNISNKLPGGRNPLLHHCFPIHAEPAGPDTPHQEFVDVFSLMKSEGWCLGIDIAVSSDKTPTAGTALHPRMTPGASTAVHSAPGGPGSNLSYGAGRCGGLPAGSSAAGPSGVAASCWHYYQPYTIPHAFIGEFQMKYIIEMVETLANPTAVVRISRKLKPFYARDRRPEAAAAAKALAAVRSQIVQMPLLKQRVDISLLADVYRVHHDAQDSEDPSDMVYIHLSSVRYMNTFTYSRYKRTQQLSNGNRLKDSMRQFMASLTVEAYDLKIVKPQGDQLSAKLGASVGSSGTMPTGQQTPTGAGSRRPAAAGVPGYVDQADRVRSVWDPRTPPRSGLGAVGGGSPSRGSPLKGQSRDKSSTEEESDVPGFSQGLVAAAACFLLRQAPTEGASGGGGAPSEAAAPGVIPIDPPPVPKSPIHMIAQDVKLLCPAELRDTGMLLFHHMQKSFSGIAFGQPRGPVRISTKKQQAQQADSLNDGLARDRSDGLRAGSSLGRSSAPVSSAVGPSAAGLLTRQTSADTASLAAGPGDAADPTSAGGAAGSAAAANNNSMVSTPLEEENMLQRILRENHSAAAARAKLQAKRRNRSIGELSVSSTNSKGSGSAAGEAAAADRLGLEALSDTAAGSGHAAAAARAVQGTSDASRLSVAAASDGADSPSSATHCDSAGRATEVSDSPRYQKGAGSAVEEVLLEYEIQFVQVQVNLVSDSARGSLVLGTNSAQLLGHLNVSKLERSVSFKMDQVQAHVACSELDPRQGPLWLEIANGKLSIPRDAEDVMRQVLLPFKCQLVTTKQATSSATAAALNSSTQAQLQLQPPGLQQRSDRKSSSSGLPPAGFAPAGQELRLHVPSIGARLDSRQFEVLVDVIQNIAMAPMPMFPPSVRGMWQHPDGTSEDDDNQDVLYALETLQSLRERQRGLQHELLAVWQAQQQYQQLQQQYAQLAAQQQSRAATRYPGSVVSGWDEASSYGEAFSEYTGHAGSTTSVGQQQGLSSLAVPSNQGPLHTDVKEAATALVIALAKAGALFGQQQHPTAGGLLRRALVGPTSMSSSSSARRATAVGASTSSNSLLSLSLGSSTAAGAVSALQQMDQLMLVSDRQTLIWWAQEQLQGALDAITASRVVLNLLRNEAGLLKVRQRDSMGVSLTVDTIDWALSKGNTVIVQGELQGISYQSIRSEDHTGTTKIQLHTATFKDPKAAAAAASTSKAHSGSQGPYSLDPGLPEGGSPHSSAAASTDDASDAGVILAPWNPDESWERDELVRIYAIHGALEKRHVVYEHIEVLVHPIRVHLTAALAAALQDYFNLKDEDNKLQSGVAGKGGKQAGTTADKRRTTASGDLPAAGSFGATATPSTGNSKAIPGSSSSLTPSNGTAGPLTAAAPRNKASIFHRRAAAQAAAKAATAAAAAAAAAQSTASAAGSSTAPAQPQIVVPPVNMGDVNIHSLTVSTGSSLTSADSPASELPAHVAGTASAAVATNDASSVAAGSIADTAAPSTVYAAPSEVDSGYYAASVTSGVSAGGDVLLPVSPGPCVQPVSADAALMMRYGAVVKGRAGRVAAATPGTPVGSAGGASGPGAFTTAAAGGTGPGSSGGYGSSAAGAAGSAAPPLTPSGGGGGASTPGAGTAAAAAAAAVKKPVRSILFKHVRFNRMHAKLTYEGPPLSISGFGLVLDNRVYRNIDGGWRSVLNRYKWDAIRSLVKSFSGLQARKLHELQIPSYSADPADSFDALRSSTGFKAGLMSLLKGKRPAGAGKLRMNSTESQGLLGAGGYKKKNEDPDGSVRDGSVAGEDGAAVLGGGSDYVVLMRDAVRAKHKAKKMALLLGNVPPLPLQPMAMEM